MLWTGLCQVQRITQILRCEDEEKEEEEEEEEEEKRKWKKKKLEKNEIKKRMSDLNPARSRP